jgi:hypothetical protein
VSGKFGAAYQCAPVNSFAGAHLFCRHDHFGFVAQEIGKLLIGQRLFPISAKAS